MFGTMTDINSQKLSEKAHIIAKKRFSLIFNSAAEAIYEIDIGGNCTFVNQACIKMLGYDSKDQLIGQNMHNLIHYSMADDRNNSIDECRIYKAFRRGSGAHVDDEVFWRKDGSSFPIEYWSYPINQNGDIIGSVVTFFDITEQKQAKEEKEKLLSDRAERIKELQCMYGITESIRRHSSLNDILFDITTLMPQGWKYPEYAVVRITLDDKEYTSNTFTLTEWKMSSDLIIDNKYMGSVEIYYLKEFPELHDGPFLSHEYNLIDAIAKTLSEAIEHKNAQAELEHLAAHDVLTGLYNRKTLEQGVNNEILSSARYERVLSVFMLDIDHFKQINDTHGHQVGDLVLQNFAKLLLDSIRNTDYAARYGGEEFIIVLPETSLAKANELGERLRMNIAQHAIILESERTLNITASIGISNFPKHANSWRDLLLIAETAMYTAKNAGRNQVRIG